MSPLRVFIFEIATGHFRSQVFIEKRAGYFFQSVDLVSTLHLTKKDFFCFPFPEIKELLKILSHDKLFNSKYRFKSVKRIDNYVARYSIHVQQGWQNLKYTRA